MTSTGIRQEIDLGGQVAIVTGGGRGIGRAMAQALAKAGTAVAVVARSEDQLTATVALIEGAGGRAIALPIDVTDQQAVEHMVAETELVLFLASVQADALSGCFIRVDDDAAEMVRRAKDIRQDGLHTLRLRTWVSALHLERFKQEIDVVSATRFPLFGIA